jgi:twitching motility two-component system response regulator PilH
MEGTRRSILVVEDDPVLQRMMARTLENEKFTVAVALDYESAVRQLALRKPSLATIDLQLPRESGFELCEYIRKQPELIYVPILVTSDHAYPEDMAHAEEAGANAFLRKPFTMKQLVKYVHAILDGPHSSRPSVRRLRLT